MLKIPSSGGGGGLPSEYQQVEWVGFALGCYFDLGTINWFAPGFEIDFEMPDSRPGNYGPHLISCDTSYLWLVPRANDTNFTVTGMDTSTIYAQRFGPISLASRHTASLKNNIAKVDNTTKALTVGTTVYSGHMVVGAYGGDPTGSSYLFGGKIHSLKFYDGDAVTKILIPCYRKSDGEIGMYDTVSQAFFTNAGTGAFTKGADV